MATANATRWATAAATVVGSSHARDGTAAQDVVGVAVLDDGLTAVVAVADGAGSAREGGTGAALAVAAALDAAASAVTAGCPAVDAANAALDAARAAVELAADAGPLGDFATTLVVGVITEAKVSASVIGDSVIVVASGGELFVVTGEPGEYINETTFLTSGDWETARRSAEIEGPIDGVAAFSDGIALLALDAVDGSAHEPFFAPLFAFAAQPGADDPDAALGAFLASPRVRERTDDDVTLALVVPRADAPG